MYPIDKYKFVVRPARIDKSGIEHGQEVIAISHYANKPVKGIAKCDPRDEFNLGYGKEIAAARCNQKVCEKRAVTLTKKCEDIARQLDELTVLYNKMCSHKRKAFEELNEATSYLALLENN